MQNVNMLKPKMQNPINICKLNFYKLLVCLMLLVIYCAHYFDYGYVIMFSLLLKRLFVVIALCYNHILWLTCQVLFIYD